VGTIVPGFCRPAEAELLTIDCDLSDDLMRGADAIAAFVGQLLRREVPRKLVYQWADKGLLPVGKHGGLYLGSKRRIAAYFAASASGPTTATAIPDRNSHRPQPDRRRRQPRRVAKHPISQGIADPIAVGFEAALAASTNNSLRDIAKEPGNTIAVAPPRRKPQDEQRRPNLIVSE
jgi:hypothetical protein